MLLYVLYNDLSFANFFTMALRITYLQIVSVIILVTVYETIAGTAIVQGDLSHMDNIPNTCFSYELSFTFTVCN